MTKQEFIYALRKKLGDDDNQAYLDETAYTDADLEKIVDEALRFILSSTHPNLLSNFVIKEDLLPIIESESSTHRKDVDSYVEVTNGNFGVLSVKILGQTQRYCEKIDRVDLKRYENIYLEPSIDSPIWYHAYQSSSSEGSKQIFIKPALKVEDTVEVQYISEFSFASLGATDKFKIEPYLLDALMYVSESIGWREEGQTAKMETSYSMGVQLLTMLNQKESVEPLGQTNAGVNS